MVAKPQLVTADELLEMPDDGHCYELVRGAFQKTAPSGSRDSIAAVHVVASLYNHAKSNNLGTVSGADGGFLLARDPDLVRVPDAAFVRREQVEEVGMVDGFWPGAPDLAVEVVSLQDLYDEVVEKVDDWLAAGTRMVVVVNPRNRTASVRLPGRNPDILTERDTLYGGEVVPGWTMPVADIFA